MKNNLTLLVVLFAGILISGCSPQPGEHKSLENFEDEETLNGSEISFEEFIKNIQEMTVSTDTIMEMPLASYPNKGRSDSGIPLSRKDLEEMRMVIKKYSGTQNAGITVPGFGGAILGKDESNLNVYFIETKEVISNNDTVVYGIGYSSHLLFKKVKKGLNLSKLPYVAASVQMENNRTEVYYSIQSYGVAGNNIGLFFKPVVDKPFDVEGFAIMQSSLNGIHNVMMDEVLSKTLRFTPRPLNGIKANELDL